MNFFIDAAMGMGNSGVEHAEFYRAKRFDQQGIPYRYVFLDIIPELHRAMDRWGLGDDQVINVWEYFVLGPEYLKHGLQERISEANVPTIDGTNTIRQRDITTDSGMRVVYHYSKHRDIRKKDNPILVVQNTRTEIFNARTGERKVMYEEVDDFHRGTEVINIHLFNENGKHLFFRNRMTLFRYFFEQLDQSFGAPSTFIIDRGEHVSPGLMTNRIPDSKLIYIVHADHLVDIKDGHPLWNNHYEYLLTHVGEIDRVVVATKLQADDMREELPMYAEKFVEIPVGGVRDRQKKLTPRNLSQPLKLITASRLAEEKHIEILVDAVARLIKEGEAVTLDIYGAGGQDKPLKKQIKELQLEDAVTLKGLSPDLEHVYPQYDAFLSASYSEGFGLTYIEALNAGLPVVTFAAKYGAMELVHDDQNGFLQPFKYGNASYNTDQMVAGIKRLMKADYKQLQKNTKTSVKPYRDAVIAQKWEDLINGL